jgi:uncharacterized membrane protein
MGTAAALALLIALVIMLGQSLTRIPLSAVQLVVGTLLLLFGLRWLRKAILRGAGVLPLHDEAEAFARETAALRRQDGNGRERIDKVAFATSFKIVMLEGIEVVFIVIAIGAGGHLIVPASAGALLALLVVVALGLCLHRPLANVPENALKFVVGVMLAAFGTFWVGEAIGLAWLGGDWAVVALIAAYLTTTLAVVPLCKRLSSGPSGATKLGISAAPKGAVATIAKELLGLFVDDGWLAGSVVLWVVAMWLAAEGSIVTPGEAGVTFAMGVVGLLAASAIRCAAQGGTS